MKTADLIADLARDLKPVTAGAGARRLAAPLLVATAISAVAVVLWLGMRPMDQAVATSAFWMKGAYTLALALAGGLLVQRLSRPGGAPGAGVWLAIAGLAAMGALAAGEFMLSPPSDRMGLWMGGSWNICPFRILALSAPVYAGLVLGMRRLAPTRPGLSGAAAGFLAGAVGATVYQLYCPETGAMFVATWYTLGIVICTAVGGLLGLRALRW